MQLSSRCAETKIFDVYIFLTRRKTCLQKDFDVGPISIRWRGRELNEVPLLTWQVLYTLTGLIWSPGFTLQQSHFVQFPLFIIVRLQSHQKPIVKTLFLFVLKTRAAPICWYKIRPTWICLVWNQNYYDNIRSFTEFWHKPVCGIFYSWNKQHYDF